MDSGAKLYFSFCKEDQEWAERIKSPFDKDKRLTCFDKSLIPFGRNKVDYCRQQFEQSRIIVVLISPAYLQTTDDLLEIELEWARTRRPDGPLICWIPVRDLGDLASPFEELMPATGFGEPLAALSPEDQQQAVRKVYQGALGVLELSDREFDVFLCHNSEDKAQVEAIARALRRQNLKPWFDEWEIQPGMTFRKELEKQIESINAAAVFIGAAGMGPWQDEEIDSFLRQFIERRCPVIPVLLPDAGDEPELPQFLRNRNWVDLRQDYDESLNRLVRSLTGKEVQLDRREPAPRQEAALELPSGEVLASCAPVTIAIEAEGDPIPGTQLLSTERHLTVQLPVGSARRLSEISDQLASPPDSFDALETLGDEAWRLLQSAQPRLVGVFVAALESKHPQPIAWAGKATLLVQLYRAILAARFSRDGGAPVLLSVDCGSHYFHPMFQEERQHRVPPRSDGPPQIGRIERLPSALDGRASRGIEALRNEVLVVDGLDELDDVQRLLELGAQADSRTRAIVQLRERSPTAELLQSLFDRVPFVSQVGRCVGGADLAAMLEATLPPRAERQTLPCVMAAVRSTWLEHFAAQRRLEDYAAALLWSSWSWIGRPLFASEFGQEIPASYPHLMDLRAVASKEWYYNRTKDIPEKYTADALARSDIEPGDRFHFYITGAGGTGKSCFIRYIYQQLEQQPNVFPIWYRVDTPSSDWKNVEDGIKLEVKRRISESLSRDAAAAALPSDDLELKYYLKELHKRLRDSELGTEKIFVFIDQLERTFESGDNPEPKRLDDISKAVVALLKEVKADQGIQIFLASRKQYLPDFLSSYENASKNKLHFNVLQTIGDTSEQVGFVDRVLSWCRDDRNLVHESVKFDESAAKLLTTNARGHPLNMMLALIQVFSLDRKGTIGTEWVAENRPWDNQNLFGLDLNLFAKDDIDWFFLLAMAHARTEIVRIEEVWWYLRLVEAKLTKRVDDLGPKGVFERLWLLGHVGRTIYARSIEKGVARFVEFFHANLRDHLIKEVMNQGGLVGSTGRRGGTPPVWRALDRLASAARDWDQSQQLLQADDVRVMMEHRIVLTERLQREEKDEETFFLLFLRDQKEARARLCEAAKQCFAYSAIVHDDFGRWAFENLFPDIEQRTALCRQWLTRCDKDSRMSVLRYLIETESPVTRELLAELVADDGDVHGDAEAWREIAEILTEPRLAARYRTNVVLAVLRHSLQEVAAPPERFPDRVDEFCVASCEGSRDELQVLLRDCTAQLKGRSDRESAVALEVLASDQVTDAWLGRAERTRLSPAARDRSGTGRVAPPKVELLLGTRIGAEIPEDQPRLWQSALAEKLGIAVPPLETARKRDEEEDETKQAYFECGIELKIKGESIAIDNFYPGRSLVFKRHLAHADSVDLSDAEVDYNFGFQEDVYWLPERGIDQPDVRRRALPTLDAIERWLELAMRDHVDKFLDLEQLIEFLKGIADEIDVSQLFHGVSLPALRRILVNLVEESVPLTGRRVELMEELQRLITQGGDTDVISQKLREHVSRDLCERLADDSGRLPILILGERLEADLKNEYLQIDDGFPLLRLPPRLAQHLVATVVRQTNRILEEDDVLPVVACEAPLRFPLARLFKRFDSRIHVISYTELSTEVVPEIRDQITAEQD